MSVVHWASLSSRAFVSGSLSGEISDLCGYVVSSLQLSPASQTIIASRHPQGARVPGKTNEAFGKFSNSDLNVDHLTKTSALGSICLAAALLS